MSSESSEFEMEITKEFMEDILQKEIISLEVKKGSNPGDNFTSILFALDIELKGESEPLHLLLKTYPALESRQKFLNEMNLFLKEIKVYDEFIPDLINFQREKGSSHQVIKPALPPFVTGKAIDFSKENLDDVKVLSPLDNYLVMVDIRKTWGFQMVEKQIGLDFKHASLAVAELAKLHALSWAYKQKKNVKSLISIYPYLYDLCFSRSNSPCESMLLSNLDLIENIVREHFPGDCRALKAIAKIKNIGPINMMQWFLPMDGVVRDHMIQKYFPGLEINDQDGDEEPWLVGCHGDSWVNNMLFRYEDSDDSPLEIIFVDLQMYREGCPTTDLAYMLYSSTNYDTRKEHLSSLLKLYHDQFQNYCNALGVKPLKNFNLESLSCRFNRARLFGFLSATLVLPIILSKTGDTDLDSMKISSEGEDSDGKDKPTLSDLMKSLTENSGANQLLVTRFTDIISDMMDNNIF